jgi:hypothetical protein
MFHDSLRNRRSFSHQFKRDAVHRIANPGYSFGPQTPATCPPTDCQAARPTQGPDWGGR